MPSFIGLPLARAAMMPEQAAPRLSLQLRSASQSLAVQVNEGMFAGAEPEARTELIGLSMMLDAWADRLETEELMPGSLGMMLRRLRGPRVLRKLQKLFTRGRS